MPSFDVVSEIDMHEAANAVDQANREVSTRFDFKGSGARFDQAGAVITLQADTEFQLGQMLDILQTKLTKRGVDIDCLHIEEPRVSGRQALQTVTLRQGLDTPLARTIVKRVKESKLKVQCAIQGEKVRISAKKRDDLQRAMALLRETKLDLPIQFDNLRQ